MSTDEKLVQAINTAHDVGATEVDEFVRGDILKEVTGALDRPGEAIDDLSPLIRRDYTAEGRLLDSGALVLRTAFARGDQVDLVINDEHRPLSELVISYLGAIANEKLRLAQEDHALLETNRWRAMNGDYIHNVIAS